MIAKPGLDGHDRGAKIIARSLRDAGMEVIYTGLHQTPEQIVETAIQEDADAVGISILSGAHMTLVPRIVEGLRANDAGDVLVVVGGTIPPEDADELKRLGVERGLHAGRPDERDRRVPPRRAGPGLARAARIGIDARPRVVVDARRSAGSIVDRRRRAVRPASSSRVDAAGARDARGDERAGLAAQRRRRDLRAAPCRP